MVSVRTQVSLVMLQMWSLKDVTELQVRLEPTLARLSLMSICVGWPLQLFKGKFYYCVGFDVKNITNKSDCLAANYRWVHHKYNFDNLGQVLETVACHRCRFIH